MEFLEVTFFIDCMSVLLVNIYPRPSLLDMVSSSHGLSHVVNPEHQVTSKGGCELRAELPRADLVLKEKIQLRVRQTLGLRQAEEGPHQEHKSNTHPEERALGTPVPVVLAHHLGHDDVGNKAGSVVARTGEGDGLDTEAGGGHLGDEGVASRSESELETELHDDEERADGPGACLVGLWDANAADDEENDGHHAETRDVESATADVGHDPPGDEAAEETETVLADAERVGIVSRQTGLAHELDAVAHEGDTAEGLSNLYTVTCQLL